MTKRYPTQNGHPPSVIPYIGGKSALIDCIVPIIVYAAKAYGSDRYYEVCGGGARMLLNLPPAQFQFRSYSELDLGLCQFFACLGCEESLADLQNTLLDWGCSEETFMWAKQALAIDEERHRSNSSYVMSRVEGAACTFVLAMMSRAGNCVDFDQSSVRDRGRIRSYFKRVEELHLFFPTMEDVEVTCGDCFAVLRQIQERQDVVIYVDPPYAPDMMKTSKTYRKGNFTMADHERLVDVLLSTTAKVVLSGYDTPSYHRLENAGWEKVFLKDVHVSSSAKSGQRMDEFVWINFEIPASLLDRQ